MKDTSVDGRRTLVMHRRRWTAYFALPFSIMLLIGGIWAAVIVRSQLEGNFGIAVAAFSLFSALYIGIPLGRSSWIALTNKEPALVVDSRGIADHFHLDVFLPWGNVQSVGFDGDSLTIVLRDGAKTPGGKPVEPGMTRTLKRAITGGDLTIPLAKLSYNPYKLRDLLTYYTRKHPSA
jgi:hypothetical protein